MRLDLFTILFIKFMWILILTLFMCWNAISLLYWLNVLLHKSQQYGHWQVHISCVITWICIINDISYTSQQYVCSTLCMRWWITISLFRMNVLLHTLQQYGRSPLCKRLCVIRLLFWVNVSLHTSQHYGCSPLCKCMCVIRLLLWVNVLLQISQQYGRSPLCKRLCVIR
jgi:hypothetical protein